MKLLIISILIALLFVTACATRVPQAVAPSVNDSPIYNNNEQEPQPPVVEEVVKGFPLPIIDMTIDDKYNTEEGGLYGKGLNIPPSGFRETALSLESEIQPLDTNGNPASDGKIGFVSIGTAETGLEFGVFMTASASDVELNPSIVFANGADGGADLYVWATNGAPWAKLEDKVLRADLTKKQVEVAWIKLSNTKPTGEFQKTARNYQDYLKTIVLRLKSEYPNVKIVYLSSNIYGGYDTEQINPEPYAYESAYSIRWLINDQINGNIALNHDKSKGTIRAPIMLWGPYMWANGEEPRSDGLTWLAEDFEDDGSTLSKSGLAKTTTLLMDYFKYNDLASKWFLKNTE